MLLALECALGRNFKPINFSLRNMVLSYAVGRAINLVEFYDRHKSKCSYEVELFPGLIYRSQSPKVTFTLFASGKVNATGIKTENEKEEAIKLLDEWFRPRPSQNV